MKRNLLFRFDDDVQRVPKLFTSLKAEVDCRRVPGRFILTGSANVLLVPRMADSLAERVAAGGYPSALAHATPRRRMAWYRDYADTLIRCDIRDKDKVEIDVVLASGGRVAGAEVKAAVRAPITDRARF